MRKETQKIMSAFLKGEKASVGRTNTDGHNVWLHGNLIVEQGETKTWFTLAGWPTATTRDRINGLLKLSGSGCRVFQRNGKQFFSNGDGAREINCNEWVTV